MMRKQVTFAQGSTETQLQKHRFSLPAETKLVKDVELCQQRRYSMPSDHRATVHIPRSLATAPFLKHSGLTPAQREYLYSVASTYSGDRVRDIISTHYMNILHRCIRAGHTVEKNNILTSVTLPQMVEPTQAEVVSIPNIENKPTSSKNKGKSSTAARNYEKTTLPKINKKQPRHLKTPVSKQRKKLATPPKLKKKTTGVSVRALSPDEDDNDDEDWLKDWLDEDEEEEKEWKGGREEEEQSVKECLSDGLSSLSLTDWDSDSDS